MRSIDQKIVRMRPLWAVCALWVVTAVLAPSAWAHKPSDAYLRVADVAAAPSTSDSTGASKNAIALTLSIALKDVDAALEQLDADGNRQLTWGEVRQATPAITQWAGNGAQWLCGGSAVAPIWHFEALEERTDGRYVRLAAGCWLVGAGLWSDTRVRLFWGVGGGGHFRPVARVGAGRLQPWGASRAAHGGGAVVRGVCGADALVAVSHGGGVGRVGGAAVAVAVLDGAALGFSLAALSAVVCVQRA